MPVGPRGASPPDDPPPGAPAPRHPPDCLKCRHFFVSWDPKFPRGCRVFGIKSRQLPGIEVFLSTGRHCPAFERSARVRER